MLKTLTKKNLLYDPLATDCIYSSIIRKVSDGSYPIRSTAENKMLKNYLNLFDFFFTLFVERLEEYQIEGFTEHLLSNIKLDSELFSKSGLKIELGPKVEILKRLKQINYLNEIKTFKVGPPNVYLSFEVDDKLFVQQLLRRRYSLYLEVYKLIKQRIIPPLPKYDKESIWIEESEDMLYFNCFNRLFPLWVKIAAISINLRSTDNSYRTNFVSLNPSYYPKELTRSIPLYLGLIMRSYRIPQLVLNKSQRQKRIHINLSLNRIYLYITQSTTVDQNLKVRLINCFNEKNFEKLSRSLLSLNPRLKEIKFTLNRDL